MKSRQATLGSLLLGVAALVGCDGPGASEDPAAWTLGQHASALSVGTPALVLDIAPPPAPTTPSAGSEPSQFVQVGDKLFFIATDALHGRELRVSDGTAAGTRLVLDIARDTGSRHIGGLTAFNGLLYFRAGDASSTRLWRSDGTPEGTSPLFPEGSASFDLDVDELKVVGGTLYLSAGTNGERELWKSDGTPQGTVRVKDINTQSTWASAGVRHLTEMGGKLYFLADDGVRGRELWTSDGTAAGTVLVKEFVAGSAGVSVPLKRPLLAVDNALYVSVETPAALWKSDGTASGTFQLKSFVDYGHPQELTRVGSTLFFSANDGVSGFELWKSQGTAASTVLVKDTQLGSSSSYPSNLTEVDGALYFNCGMTQGGLFRSDGTEAGTLRVATTQSIGWEGSFARMGSGLYFFEFGAQSAYSLSRYDTVTGQKAVLKTFTSRDWRLYNVSNYVAFGARGDTLFFAAEDATLGVEPWKTDGTAEGTVPLADLHGPDHGARPRAMVDLGGKLLFVVNGASGQELWTNAWAPPGGMPAPARLKDGFSAILEPMVVLNGKVYFSASTSATGYELWSSDGTPSGTGLVKDILPGADSASPSRLTAFHGKLLFSATTPGTGAELWVSDGTEAGTALLKDINPGATGSGLNIHGVIGTEAYLSANNGVHGTELWKTDGTAAGTVLVKDVLPGAAHSHPRELRGVNGSLVFVALSSSGQDVLWRLDASGVVQQVTLSASAGTPSGLTLHNGTLFFFTHSILWKYDGTSAAATAVASNRFVSPSSLVSVGNTLFFLASTQTQGLELWRSDGTSAGTALVRDVLPGRQGGVVGGLVGLPAQGLVVFRATDGAHGVEPWVSDGTEGGTRMLADLAPGALTSNPLGFTLSGDSVFFSADEGTLGAELWRAPLVDAIEDTVPPTGSVVSPLSQQLAGATVSMEVRGSDNVGVTRLEAYVDGALVREATFSSVLNASLSFSWSDVSASDGAHTVLVRVHDAAGLVGESAPVQFHVDRTPPSASILSPQEGQSVEGLVSVTADVTDARGVAFVDLLVDGQQRARLSSAPYVFTWDSRSATVGAHTLVVRATDTVGNVAQSPTRQVSIAPDTTPPTVSISSPTEGSTHSGASVTVAASATDGRGVSRVEFYVGASLLGTDSTSPYSVSWNTASLANGTYSLTARAFDAAGNSATSTPVSVIVSDTTAPLVSITAPTQGATVTGTTTLSVSTSDNRGVVSRVEYSVNDALLGSVSTSPYSLAWNTAGLTPGSYRLRARAYDAAGNVGTSAEVTVTVSAASSNTLTYSASNTSSATVNTVNRTIPLTGGQRLTLGTCGVTGASYSGDTYLRLYGPSGTQVAANDDACGVGSNFTYTVPAGAGGNYQLRAGCYSSGSCSGTVAWTIQ
jgi:ELWxxDGT repeat protein